MIAAAEAQLRAAEGRRTTARTFGNPVLAYQVDQTSFPSGRPLPNMEREAMTTATLPLEGLYQRGPRAARAGAEIRAAESDLATARQRIGLEAAMAYYRTAAAQIESSVAHDLVSWLDTLVAYNRSRVAEGAAAEADLIRSELERDRMTAEAAMSDAELAQSRATLSTFLNVARGPNTTVVAMADAATPLPATSASLSFETRPDLRVARARSDAATAGIAAERSMVLRQFGATIGVMRTGPTSSMIAGFSLPLPVFDSNRGEIRRANAERDVASLELVARERSAAGEFPGASEVARLLTERVNALSRRDSSGYLARADEARRIALAAYREGAVPLLQVIDAARAWGDARLTFYRLVFAQHQSVLTLVVAGGGDLFAYVAGNDQ
jgi:cobalt-zinc-cadmium efflux system outer membrane protein